MVAWRLGAARSSADQASRLTDAHNIAPDSHLAYSARLALIAPSRAISASQLLCGGVAPPTV
jgi:hypothetical protein